jgi:hypothetical protein
LAGHGRALGDKVGDEDIPAKRCAAKRVLHTFRGQHATPKCPVDGIDYSGKPLVSGIRKVGKYATYKARSQTKEI